MFRIRKLFRFEAAHILSRAFTKECFECIHGHSYKVEIFLTSKTLDGNDMVLDFGRLSTVIQEIKECWDHALLLPIEMKWIPPEQFKKVRRITGNPTAELMAMIIFDKVIPTLPAGVNVERVRVHETESGWAEYEGE